MSPSTPFDSWLPETSWNGYDLPTRRVTNRHQSSSPASEPYDRSPSARVKSSSRAAMERSTAAASSVEPMSPSAEKRTLGASVRAGLGEGVLDGPVGVPLAVGLGAAEEGASRDDVRTASSGPEAVQPATARSDATPT